VPSSAGLISGEISNLRLPSLTQVETCAACNCSWYWILFLSRLSSFNTSWRSLCVGTLLVMVCSVFRYSLRYWRVAHTNSGLCIHLIKRMGGPFLRALCARVGTTGFYDKRLDSVVIEMKPESSLSLSAGCVDTREVYSSASKSHDGWPCAPTFTNDVKVGHPPRPTLLSRSAYPAKKKR